MITINKVTPGPDLIIHGYEKEEILLFDIETTGFVADKSFLYLIGCIYYKENTWNLVQWFCEIPDDEPLLLHTFIEFAKKFKVCIHYNGTTFDIPYVTRKCKRHAIDFAFEDLRSIDLYQTAFAMKKLFNLSSCTQKSIEKLFGIAREDQYSGGELIQVYANYVGLSQLEKLQKKHKQDSPGSSMNPLEPSASELLHLLLLHNEDDLYGLLSITSILNYERLLDGEYAIDHMQINENDQLIFHLSFDYSLPAVLDLSHSGVELHALQNECVLAISLKEGTLKYFIDNYTDYYYLPMEDTVVHKSIAASMDKSYRQRATKENCYVKKLSIYLPQFEPIWTPVFREARKDVITYLECTEERLRQEEFQKEYTMHLLNSCITVRRKKKKTS